MDALEQSAIPAYSLRTGKYHDPAAPISAPPALEGPQVATVGPLESIVASAAFEDALRATPFTT